jgi:hypothetical protein
MWAAAATPSVLNITAPAQASLGMLAQFACSLHPANKKGVALQRPSDPSILFDGIY